MRLSRRTKKNIIIGMAAGVVLIGAFCAFYLISTKQIRAVYEEQLQAKQGIIDGITKDVYVTTRDIKYGEQISENDVMKATMLVELDGMMFMGAEDIGSVAAVDIPKEHVVTKDMVLEENCDPSLRETQFDVIILNSNLVDGDYVDVRIRFQNGEDYVVLSKKKVKHLSLYNAVCYMDLTEEEAQISSSAIVDASVYSAILYTTTYVHPEVQDASVVTYCPSADISSWIEENPNILSIATERLSIQAREAMEERLSAYGSRLIGEGTVANITETKDITTSGNMQTLPSDYLNEENNTDEAE